MRIHFYKILICFNHIVNWIKCLRLKWKPFSLCAICMSVNYILFALATCCWQQKCPFLLLFRFDVFALTWFAFNLDHLLCLFEWLCLMTVSLVLLCFALQFLYCCTLTTLFISIAFCRMWFFHFYWAQRYRTNVSVFSHFSKRKRRKKPLAEDGICGVSNYRNITISSFSCTPKRFSCAFVCLYLVHSLDDLYLLCLSLYLSMLMHFQVIFRFTRHTASLISTRTSKPIPQINN